VTAVVTLAPCFVEDVPEVLEPGVLYVSLEHGSMMHLCACGCGSEVALPLSPLDWRFTFDGETISLWPSVGSWSLPCRSHYIVDHGCIRWAGDWTDQQIEAGRQLDRRRRDARRGAPPTPSAPILAMEAADPDGVAAGPKSRGMFDWIWRRLPGWRNRP